MAAQLLIMPYSILLGFRCENREESLRQWYFLRIGRKELNAGTRTRTLELLRPTMTMIVIY